MRKLVLTIALALAVPALAAAANLTAGDGSLGVTSANGTIVVQGQGLIYGHFDAGTLLILQYKPDDGVSTPSITGGKTKLTRFGNGSVTGSDVRFLFPSGRYTIQLIATDVNASAIGKGTIVANGFGTADDGSFSVNGGKAELLGVKGATSDAFGKGP